MTFPGFLPWPRFEEPGRYPTPGTLASFSTAAGRACTRFASTGQGRRRRFLERSISGDDFSFDVCSRPSRHELLDFAGRGAEPHQDVDGIAHRSGSRQAQTSLPVRDSCVGAAQPSAAETRLFADQLLSQVLEQLRKRGDLVGRFDGAQSRRPFVVTRVHDPNMPRAVLQPSYRQSGIFVACVGRGGDVEAIAVSGRASFDQRDARPPPRKSRRSIFLKGFFKVLSIRATRQQPARVVSARSNPSSRPPGEYVGMRGLRAVGSRKV